MWLFRPSKKTTVAARTVITKELWTLPVPSTALLGVGVVLLVRLRKEIALRYEFEGINDEPTPEEIVFEGVESFKFTHERACGDWVLPAYDRLVEVTESSWAAKVTEELRKRRAAQPVVRHLMIYFDSGPCYEAVCRSFRIDK